MNYLVFDDYPLAPEKCEITYVLSNYCKKIADKYSLLVM